MSYIAPTHDHERTDAKVRPLVIFLIGMFVTIVFSIGFTTVLFEFLTQRAESKQNKAAPLQIENEVPPTPQLQVVPGFDLSNQRAEEAERLESYGWVNQERKTVHLPIDKAMDVLLEKGLPVRGEE